MNKSEMCIESYKRTKNLKLTGIELGIPWQTVYVHLRKNGVQVTGDKMRYGSDRDRLSASAELRFSEIVPFAINMNNTKFQNEIDFKVGEFGIDIKASKLHQGSKQFKAKRWAFSVKKQELFADFIVCFGFDEIGHRITLLIPGELIRKYQTISISEFGKSKWLDYKITVEGLRDFFIQITDSKAA